MHRALIAVLLVGPASLGRDASARGEGGTPLPELTGRPARAGKTGAVPPGAPKDLDTSAHLLRKSEALPRPTPLGGGGLRYAYPGWEAYVAPDGAVTFRDRRAAYRPRRAEVTFEWADGGSRRRGGDPYAMQKLRFLEDTLALRGELLSRARDRWQRAYFADLPARLARLWARRDLAPAPKRILIYDLWRECLEPTDQGWRAAAGRARAEILAFVRRHLPAGSPWAFTRVELSWMGRPQKGRETFAPYDR